MELDLQCVVSFLTLCEEGHFGRAAARLHITSPALTKQIQRLERQVGVPLLVRGPVGDTALTAAGWRFVGRAKVALEHARSAQYAAREAAYAGIPTVVRIGIPGVPPTDSMVRRVVDPIRSSRERLPGIELRAVGVPYGQFLDAVLLRLVDILWSPTPLSHPALRSHAIGTTSRVGIVPRTHPMAEMRIVAAEQFAELPLLHSSALPAEVTTEGALADVRPLEQARLVHTTAQGFAPLRNEIRRGRGMVVAPELLATGLGVDLCMVALRGLAPVEVFAVHRSDARSTSILEVIRLLGAIGASGGTGGWGRSMTSRE